MMTVYKICIDDLSGSEVKALLSEHQDRMADHSPPESRHVLDLTALKNPEITFWSMWCDDQLLGCVALKHWDETLGEIKSMKTAPSHTRKGVGKHLLKHVLEEAKARNYQHLKLETGSMAYFAPARKLYSKQGFKLCGPFGGYIEDPNSIYMSLSLG